MIADVQQPILLVAPEGRESEAITRLSRVGFDKTLGYLKGGFEAWKNSSKEYDSVTQMTAEDLRMQIEAVKAGEEGVQLPVFDVRKESEYEAERLEEAANTPLDFLNDHLAEYSGSGPMIVHCAGGYRSMIAISILKSRGIHQLIDLEGGFKAIKDAGIETTSFQCPSQNK